ncbi:hypothetical protein [Halomonas sp. HAL1]|uniref:hypothetical protein n=1 Tax=Halomonas sp. HAL1 TaxID=550984 RepID=UPI00022D3119|nr:hypothetical protein [Halomonas sp. HAL1]EHA14084.1 hypothetical protein HAL1_18801 [Halomonas sp. HAL1]WKV91767.1 hypothetical protein Q3Y66_12890 [Halomonas sp. HAL1]
MEKNIDIGVLGEKLGTDFEYREFAAGTTHSNESQRWKLLDCIAKYAPGVVHTSVESSKQTPRVPHQAHKPAIVSTLRPDTPQQKNVSRSSSFDALYENPLPTQPKRPSFGHLFEVYTDNGNEQKLGENEETSLKALLRKINS